MMTSADKVGRLRAQFAEDGLDGVLVPRSDEFLGEYVPPSAERLAWLTGFTGSAGIAVVLAERAAVFSDGRYVIQIASQTDGSVWERLHSGETPPWEWVKARAAEAGRRLRIGYDPRVMGEKDVEKFAGTSVETVALDANPVDRLWVDRPSPPSAPVRTHGEQWSGRSSADKRGTLAQGLRTDGVAAALVTDPASVAWLLNIRGGDLPAIPVALAWALLHADGAVELFIDPGKVDGTVRAWLGNAVSVSPLSAIERALDGLAGQKVRVDGSGSPAFFAQRLRAAGATVVDAPDICAEPKACKNEAERAGMRASHLRDGVALCRFLHWIEGRAGEETEISAAAALGRFRAADPACTGDSFDAISGAGEHGAIMHYHATPESDRTIGARTLYLIDSGGQYVDGTTDVTRTIWTGGGEPPAAWRGQFTRVLKGMIRIATASFPEGVTGHRIDALARDALWRAGLDFDHGTGHGVGSVLSVHEGPVSISAVHRPVPIKEGMVVSDEPGYYLPGSHGIRIENMLLAVPRAFEGAVKPFLGFETLTLAPIDRTMIDVSLLERDEREWLDGYHARVLGEIGPELDDEARGWLSGACAPV